MRSLLFAPANRPDLTAKLGRPGADAVALDLEDGTPVPEKEAARATALEGAAGLAAQDGAPEIYVRVNPEDSPFFTGDLEVLLAGGAPGIDGLVLPKVESAPQLVAVERRLTQLERAAGRPPLALILGIESAAGVEQATAILAASTRASAAYFGAEDFATDVGARRTPAAHEVAYGRARVVLAARLARVASIDQAVLEVRDDERYLEDAEPAAATSGTVASCASIPRRSRSRTASSRPAPRSSTGATGCWRPTSSRCWKAARRSSSRAA